MLLVLGLGVSFCARHILHVPKVSRHITLVYTGVKMVGKDGGGGELGHGHDYSLFVVVTLYRM